MRFLILLISVPAFANFIKPQDLPKIHAGDGGYSVYVRKQDCGSDCVSIDGIDPQVSVIQDGKLVVDANLLSQKQAAQQAKEDSKALALQKREDAKEKLKDLPSANSVAALREQVQAIKDYLGLE